MKKIGFIDYFLKEWHADNYPNWIKEASNGDMVVAYAYGMIDNPNGLETNKEWADRMGIQLLDSIESVIEKSDYLVVLSPDNSEMHFDLCQLPLKSQKPTFVDKTFAPTAKIAKELIDLANTFGTPMFSSSALRFATELADVNKEVDYINSIGPGSIGTYLVHQIEPIVKLLGTDISGVLYSGTETTPALDLKFASGRSAHITMFEDAPFSMDIIYKDGTTKRIGEMTDFFQNFAKELVRFFTEEKSSFSTSETYAVVDIIEKAHSAKLTPGAWIG